MKFTSKYFWFGLDGIVFLILNVFLIWSLWPKFSNINISWLSLSIFGLAVFRAANLISNEQITKPLREPFVDEKQKDGKTVEVPKKRGFIGAMGSLLYCPSCTGTWIAMVLFYCWVLWPWPTQAIAIILALSGLERLFTSLYNLLKR